ncbi:MAG: hypothetical protein AAF749_07310 [Pseudomonadota bacterium]
MEEELFQYYCGGEADAVPAFALHGSTGGYQHFACVGARCVEACIGAKAQHADAIAATESEGVYDEALKTLTEATQQWIQQGAGVPPGVALSQILRATGLDDTVRVLLASVETASRTLRVSASGGGLLMLLGDGQSVAVLEPAIPYESSSDWADLPETSQQLREGERVLLSVQDPVDIETAIRQVRDSIHLPAKQAGKQYLQFLRNDLSGLTQSPNSAFVLLDCGPVASLPLQSEHVSIPIDEQLLIATTRWFTHRWSSLGLPLKERQSLQPTLEAVTEDALAFKSQAEESILSIAIERFANRVEISFHDPGLPRDKSVPLGTGMYQPATSVSDAMTVDARSSGAWSEERGLNVLKLVQFQSGLSGPT